jgi:hypothetical protein
MRLSARLLALVSTALVLFAGVAPGLERCGRHAAGVGAVALAHHEMEMPAAPGAMPGDEHGPAWSASHPDQSPHSICCLYMSTCATHCFVGAGIAGARVADPPTGTSAALARALASVVAPPESPPPRA